ncbi:MAG: thiamine phosphate synthase [Planctomycetes bacterium]|jgi:thiamine-phosphate pyrophosphorylase|nr:thiamine phosphate synthase [Planctomycetota bacterium]HJM58220.1 thiamine phosphate synthase [Planctomycetota bacterium]
MSLYLPPRLLALSPGDLAPGEGFALRAADLLDRVRAARRVGLRGVLLREPQLPDGAFTGLAVSLKAILDEGWLGLHDRPHLVAGVGAQGVHLGFRSLTALEARRCVGPEVAIGVSTHAGDSPGLWEGADYLFHGPVYAPLSKPAHLAPIGLGGLREFVEPLGLPVWGLGGMTPELAPAVIAAGAAGVACLGGLLSGADPAEAYARFAEGVVL